MYSLGHGGNDAQKTMGIIWLILLAGGVVGANEELPAWVGYACLAQSHWAHCLAAGALSKPWMRQPNSDPSVALQRKRAEQSP